MLTHLIASFATLPDLRCAGRTQHRFLDLLVIAICAVVAGAERWLDIAHYGRMNHTWLATFLHLPNGIPSHDTFRRVFSLIDPQGLELPALGGHGRATFAAQSGRRGWQDHTLLD